MPKPARRRSRQTVEQTQPQRFLTVGALTRRWNLSQASVYRMVDGGAIASIRLGASGGSVRIPIDAVEQFERKQLGRVPAAIADDVA